MQERGNSGEGKGNRYYDFQIHPPRVMWSEVWKKEVDLSQPRRNQREGGRSESFPAISPVQNIQKVKTKIKTRYKNKN